VQKARWSGEWHKRTLELARTDGEGFEVFEALDHLRPGMQPDLASAFDAAFPQDRTRDDSARQDLMSEFMDDDMAQKEAEEAGAIENAGE
jgi:hypothetical protein